MSRPPLLTLSNRVPTAEWAVAAAVRRDSGSIEQWDSPSRTTMPSSGQSPERTAAAVRGMGQEMAAEE